MRKSKSSTRSGAKNSFQVKNEHKEKEENHDKMIIEEGVEHGFAPECIRWTKAITARITEEKGEKKTEKVTPCGIWLFSGQRQRKSLQGNVTQEGLSSLQHCGGRTDVHAEYSECE